MSDLQLTEKLLAGLAGWEVVKQARSIVAEDRVLSSSWQPPMLRGVVQAGPTSYRAGLVIRRENDAENLCTCRQSREWGTLCPHSIAVGLHVLKPAVSAPVSAPPGGSAARPGPGVPGPSRRPLPSRDVRRLRRAEPGATGEAVAIHVVLPPNLADGLARGKSTLFLEGDWRRGRSPLDALPFDLPFAWAPEDSRLLDAVERLAGGDTPSMLQLGSADFGSLLDVLADHPRVTFGRKQAATISRKPWPVPLEARLEANGEIVLRVRPLPRTPTLIPADPPWVLLGTAIQPLGLPRECVPALGGPMRWNRAQVPAFVTQLLPALERQSVLDANFTASTFELAPQPPRFHLHLAGGLASLTAHLQCSYGNRVMTMGITTPAEALWMPDPQVPTRYGTRDLAAERSALDRLLRHGFTGPDAQGRYQLHGQNPVLTFLAREFPRLEKEWQVTLEERLERSTQQQLERIEPQFAVTPSGEQWFDLQVSFASRGGQELPATEIQRLLRGGQSHTRLRNGKIALIDTGAVEELEEILVDCAPQQHAGGYRMSQAQAGFLTTTLQRQGWEPVAPAGWRERTRQQTGDVALACPPLGPLDSVLRPYQKQGVAWMAFLRRNGFGGVLADDMGLGKTLQALAHLSVVAREASVPAAPRLPHLVVCPKSLVFNWVREATRFTPHLKVLALEGPRREERFEGIPDSDLVITSYSLIRRDLGRYRVFEFDTVVLDEAQHIKNRQTRNAQAVKAIRSRHRLVLTGTPLENSVLDLWSILDFLMPGYLGSAQDFKERYEIPIVREKCQASQARLARRVRPFLLRRLKREVAPELPPRIDQVVWCDLTEDQAAVYAQLLDATRREVTEAVGAQGLARSRMLVLTALLRLRQACCDLRLLGAREPDSNSPTAHDAAEPPPPSPASLASSGSPGSRSSEPSASRNSGSSGKVEAFAELLEEAIDGDHRILVFSQFTRMLALLKEHLAAEEIPYCYLDGSTPDRGKVVEQFQNHAEIPVFLISLKAGGVGLNLTGADTVIHFDPWWNPAVEEQATDRAHRLGQTRVVTSYKLITRGTVEEKILALQARKREMLQGLLAGEESFTGALDWDEIQELLS